MTIETIIGSILTILVSIIGYFMQTLIIEHRKTSNSVISLTELIKFNTEEVIALKKADEITTAKLVDILERLVRLEERTGNSYAKQPTSYKYKRPTAYYKGNSPYNKTR